MDTHRLSEQVYISTKLVEVKTDNIWYHQNRKKLLKLYKKHEMCPKSMTDAIFTDLSLEE